MPTTQNPHRTGVLLVAFSVVACTGLLTAFGFTIDQFGVSELCMATGIHTLGTFDSASWAWLPVPVARCRFIDFDVATEELSVNWANTGLGAACLVVIVASVARFGMWRSR